MVEINAQLRNLCCLIQKNIREAILIRITCVIDHDQLKELIRINKTALIGKIPEHIYKTLLSCSDNGGSIEALSCHALQYVCFVFPELNSHFSMVEHTALKTFVETSKSLYVLIRSGGTVATDVLDTQIAEEKKCLCDSAAIFGLDAKYLDNLTENVDNNGDNHYLEKFLEDFESDETLLAEYLKLAEGNEKFYKPQNATIRQIENKLSEGNQVRHTLK